MIARNEGNIFGVFLRIKCLPESIAGRVVLTMAAHVNSGQ